MPKNKRLVDNMKHPMQPIGFAEGNVVRFKANKVIQWLFDTGKLDLNAMAMQNFSKQDTEQIAQLLGYSVCGYSDLSYATKKSKDQAWEIMNKLPDRK